VLPTGHARPLSLFLLSVAGSGDRKSAADKELGWALVKHERNLSDALVKVKADYQNDKEGSRPHAPQPKPRQEEKAGRREVINALDSVGQAPIAPLEAVVSFPEPTLEGCINTSPSGSPRWVCSPTRAACSSAASACRGKRA
jgi:hypothetical protein